MVVMNTAKDDKKVVINKYNERTKGFRKYLNVIDKSVGELEDFTVSSYKAVVLELQK